MDHLWLLDAYGIRRDWLNAKDETFAWKMFNSSSSTTHSFICIPTDIVERMVCDELRRSASDDRFNLVLRVNDDKSVIHATVIPASADITDMFTTPVQISTTQVDTLHRAKHLVSIRFCSTRISDEQHYIMGVCENFVVVYRFVTIEENIVRFRRNTELNDPLVVTVALSRHVHIFDLELPHVSQRFVHRRTAQLASAFRSVFPFDIIATIARLECCRIVRGEFLNGAIDGTWSYPIARMLRAMQATKSNTPSLVQYHAMDAQTRSKCYAKIKAFYRSKKHTFERSIPSRRLRSGMIC